MSKNILFICHGNACRSQLAEAFARFHGEGRVNAFSAGLKPAGFVHPKTIAVMAERGIFMEGHTSKGLDKIPLDQMDWIVTLSGDVKNGFVHPPLPAQQILHWNIDDPVAVLGKEERVLEAFRMTRDKIESNVLELIRLAG